MKSLILLISKHIDFSGCISLITMGMAKFLTVLGMVLQYTFGIVGMTVGIITIYTFLEKKGLLPKWLKIKDRKSK